jgi:hypothetical protein
MTGDTSFVRRRHKGKDSWFCQRSVKSNGFKTRLAGRIHSLSFEHVSGLRVGDLKSGTGKPNPAK